MLSSDWVSCELWVMWL